MHLVGCTVRDEPYLQFAVKCCHIISFHVCRPLQSTFLHVPGMSIELCNAFSFGYLPGVRVLKADVSELSVGSIFIGRSMKCDRDWSVWDICTGPGLGKPERSQ